MDEPEHLTTNPRRPVPNADSMAGRGHSRRRRRRDATIIAAWIGAVAAVVSASITIIPHLLSSDESHRAGSFEMTAPPLPTPTCEGCKSGKTYQEQAAHGGARTYRDPRALLGEGERVPSLQKIDVLCKLYSPVPGSPSVGKYWYLVVSPPWNGRYYTVANSYLNGDSPDPHEGTHDTVVDLRVPDCW